MARTALTVVSAAPYGVGINDIAAQAVDQPNGNSMANDGNTVIVVANASGGDLTITVTPNGGPYNHGDTGARTLLVVATAKTAFIGPFNTNVFGTTLLIDWSTGTSVTAAPVKLARTPTI